METEEVPAQPEFAMDLDELDVRFRRLITGYAEALGEAERVHRVKAGNPSRKETEPSSVPKSTLTMFGPLVRLLVGSHIRKRLNDLVRRFSQVEPALAMRGGGAETRGWFAERRPLVETMASNLPSLKIPGIFVVAPFAITLITAFGKLSATAWALVLLLVILPAAVTVVALVQAYRRKRELFLTGAATVDREAPQRQGNHTGHNLYRAEEELFSLLGSRRRREMEVDAFAIAWSCFLLAELCFFVPVLLDSASIGVDFAGLGLGFAVLLINFLIARRLPKRVWK